MTLRTDLWPIAVDQYGFITTNDAKKIGANPHELAKLAMRDKLEHVGHGLYRFPELPVTERDDYMRAVLATGVDGALLSHDTALAVHELCDINPDLIHVTINRGDRVRRKLDGIKLHHDNVEAADRTWWEQIPVVTPAQAIKQGIEIRVPTYLLTQAFETARVRGLLKPVQVIELERAMKVTA